MRSDDMISNVHIAIQRAAMKQNLIICGVVIAVGQLMGIVVFSSAGHVGRTHYAKVAIFLIRKKSRDITRSAVIG